LVLVDIIIADASDLIQLLVKKTLEDPIHPCYERHAVSGAGAGALA